MNLRLDQHWTGIVLILGAIGIPLGWALYWLGKGWLWA